MVKYIPVDEQTRTNLLESILLSDESGAPISTFLSALSSVQKRMDKLRCILKERSTKNLCYQLVEEHLSNINNLLTKGVLGLSPTGDLVLAYDAPSESSQEPKQEVWFYQMTEVGLSVYMTRFRTKEERLDFSLGNGAQGQVWCQTADAWAPFDGQIDMLSKLGIGPILDETAEPPINGPNPIPTPMNVFAQMEGPLSKDKLPKIEELRARAASLGADISTFDGRNRKGIMAFLDDIEKTRASDPKPSTIKFDTPPLATIKGIMSGAPKSHDEWNALVTAPVPKPTPVDGLPAVEPGIDLSDLEETPPQRGFHKTAPAVGKPEVIDVDDLLGIAPTQTTAPEEPFVDDDSEKTVIPGSEPIAEPPRGKGGDFKQEKPTGLLAEVLVESNQIDLDRLLEDPDADNTPKPTDSDSIFEEDEVS